MIEVKGVIVRYAGGHKHVEVVVATGDSVQNKTHQVGIDIKVSKGKIMQFLSAMYDVLPGDIVWPDHVNLEDGDI